MIIGVPKKSISENDGSNCTVDDRATEETGLRSHHRKRCRNLGQLPDNLYQDAGAELIENAAEIWEKSDLVIKIRAPEMHPS